MTVVRDLLLNENGISTVTSISGYGMGNYGDGYYGSIGSAPNPPENSVTIGPVPMGFEWSIDSLICSSTSANPSTISIYENAVTDDNFIISDPGGNNGYLLISGHVLRQGDKLIAIWDGADVGSSISLRVRGVRYVYWWNGGRKYDR